MNKDLSSEFDPFRVLVSFASEANSSDLFIETFTGVGLTFDLALSSSEDYSHGTRIRALRPRVLAAYDALSAAGRLAAANAALGRFMTIRQQSREGLLAALTKIGWSFQEDRLVTIDPQIR